MARIATVLEIERGDEGIEITVDLGGEEVVLADHFEPANTDSLPLPGDSAAVEQSSGAGRWQVVGYSTPDDSEVEPGEWRVRSRSASGETMGWIHARANGDVVINGVVITADGNILAPGEVTARSEGATPIPLSTHIHLHPMAPTQGPSVPPTPGG